MKLNYRTKKDIGTERFVEITWWVTLNLRGYISDGHLYYSEPEMIILKLKFGEDIQIIECKY